MLYFWSHAAFLEACYIFGGMQCFWRHSRFLDACNVFGGMVSNRMHAMFLEAYLASRGQAPILEAPPFVLAIFWKHLHAGMQLALRNRKRQKNDSMSCLCHKVTMSSVNT